MVIMLFGVSNVGKTTTGELLSSKLKVNFYDVDREIKKTYNVNMDTFINTTSSIERDYKRGKIIKNIIEKDKNCVIAVSPMSNREYFECFLKNSNVLAINLVDTVENIFDRLIFGDENDVPYKDDEYKNKYKLHYIIEIEKDIIYYNRIYKIINNVFNMNGDNPDTVTDRIIDTYNLVR